MIPRFSASDSEKEPRPHGGGRSRFVRAARAAAASHSGADDETLERAFDRGRELRLAKALLDWSHAAQAGDREKLHSLRRDVYLLARRLAPASLARELHDLPWSLPSPGSAVTDTTVPCTIVPETTVLSTTDPETTDLDNTEPAIGEAYATDTTAAAFAEALAAALISLDRL
ncbi:MAG: hypothetical protein JNJ88_03005 [Planctomycetes bacterium]|nr:hypothetical protein [Planctomycetota bacterium]